MVVTVEMLTDLVRKVDATAAIRRGSEFFPSIKKGGAAVLLLLQRIPVGKNGYTGRTGPDVSPVKSKE
jgi:hypothetical protein